VVKLQVKSLRSNYIDTGGSGEVFQMHITFKEHMVTCSQFSLLDFFLLSIMLHIVSG
jgi:hypothetical protein